MNLRGIHVGRRRVMKGAGNDSIMGLRICHRPSQKSPLLRASHKRHIRLTTPSDDVLCA